MSEGVDVGKWGYGPFDNDTAADFAGDVAEMAPPERVEVLRAALEGVVRSRIRIDGEQAEKALAAAALASCRLDGGEKFQSRHVDASIVLPSLPDDLIGLAASVIDRLIEGDNDVSDDWVEEGKGAMWKSRLKELRSVLAGGRLVKQEGLW